MEFYRESRVRAITPHVCHICNMQIDAGQQYTKEVGVYQGDFFSRNTCDVCKAARAQFMENNTDVREYEATEIADEVTWTFCRKTCSVEEFEACTLNSLHCPKVREAYVKESE